MVSLTIIKVISPVIEEEIIMTCTSSTKQIIK